MKINKRLLAFFFIVGLIGCTVNALAEFPNLEAVKAYAKAEVEIERMRGQKNPDWDAINKQYEITSTVVKKVDAKWSTNYDLEIRQALKKCLQGEDVLVNQQILAKGLQHVTVLAIRQELDLMVNPSAIARKNSALRITAYFEGIRPTFIRRDKDFFSQDKILEKSADAALVGLLKSGPEGLLTVRREFENVINRAYALCVLYEIIEIEKLRQIDRPQCDVKRKEAKIFYRIVSENVKRRSPKTQEIILNILSGSYDAMNAQDMEKYLKAGLGGITLRGKVNR